jgi:peptide/nickel transport system permease protein
MYLAATWLAVIAFLAVFIDVLPFQDPLANNAGFGRQGPSARFWLGTDQLGRDILSRVAHGARVSLLVGVSATAIGGFAGSLLGLLSGYLRGKTETVVMGAMDIMLSFPALIFALALTSFLGPSTRNVILAIGILAIPAFARIVRAQTLSVSEREFIRVARSQGSSRVRILVREVTPNVMPTVLTYTLIIIAIAIVVEGSLSFLGFGVPPPSPSWGGMIASGRSELRNAVHISMVPAAVMFLTVLSLNFLGERLSGRFDLRGQGG